MATPATPTVWTAERVRQELVREDRAWPRYEFIDGVVLVTPSPSRESHYEAVEWLFLALRPYTRQHAIGRTMVSPADISLDGRTVVQPDVFVVPPEFLNRRDGWKWADVGALVLAVEVVSPGSERNDRWRKRLFYQRCGVGEYWIVDTRARLVERWRPTDDRPEILVDALTWTPAPDAPPLVLDLRALFDEACGPERDEPPLPPPAAPDSA